MSFLGKMFGKKEEKAPSVGETLQKLKETEDMLVKKQEYLESKIEKEIITAKKNATKNKRAAIQALKRKKRYEKQLQQIDGTFSTIETQREALEGANTNAEVLKTMKNAADALKNTHLNMDVDEVHNMMDDIADQQDLSNEISNAISNPVGFGDDVDEDELERELEGLEEEALEEKLVEVPHPHNLPAVPSAEIAKPKPAKSRVNDEDDMKELEQWAS